MPLNTIKHLARLQQCQFHSYKERWNTFQFHCDIIPFSWPMMMNLSRNDHPATVAFDSWVGISEIGLSTSRKRQLCPTKGGVEIRGPSSLIGNTTTVPTCPILCSVTASNMLPSSENSTRFTAVGNSQVCKHVPSCTFHNLIVLSALPVANNVEVAKHSVHVQGETQLQKWDLSEIGGYLQLTWMVHTAP